MDRRRFLLTSLAGGLAAPLAAEALQAGKMYRVGILWFTYPDVSAPFFTALREGLSALGYIEGENIAFDQRWAERNPDRYLTLAADLVRRRMDVIVAGNLESAVAAKAATSDIPIVITAGGDSLRSGLVRSLARPGGNVTGVSEVIPDLAPKLLQLLNEAVPKLSRLVSRSCGIQPTHRMRQLVKNSKPLPRRAESSCNRLKWGDRRKWKAHWPQWPANDPVDVSCT
jgi:ABC-type uncharacterized transport system substrate-binding protein